MVVSPTEALKGRKTTGRGATPVNGHTQSNEPQRGGGMWSDSATPDRRGNRGARGNGECGRRVERGGQLMVSVTPSGFPVRDGSVLQGLRCRFAPAIFNSLPLHRLPVVHRSYGASIRDGTPCYRGCAIAPPPACGLDTPTGFPFRNGMRGL